MGVQYIGSNAIFHFLRKRRRADAIFPAGQRYINQRNLTAEAGASVFKFKTETAGDGRVSLTDYPEFFVHDIPDARRLLKLHLQIHGWNSMGFVHGSEWISQRLTEPVFHQIVEHLKKAGIKNNAGIVGMPEANFFLFGEWGIHFFMSIRGNYFLYQIKQMRSSTATYTAAICRFRFWEAHPENESSGDIYRVLPLP